MRRRPIFLAVILASAYVALGSLAGANASASSTCTWAGTPLEPTGTFTIEPGLTNVPSAGPLKFKATGELGGECSGAATFSGQLDAGATCAFSEFEGSVKGLPGVARFWGKGSLLVPSLLYDRYGNVVGSENAEIVTEANFPHTTDCDTPEGFRGGWPAMFSSVIELY
jgi:hypothetical protein